MGRQCASDRLHQEQLTPPAKDDLTVTQRRLPDDHHQPTRLPIEDDTLLASDDAGTTYRHDDAKLARLEHKVNVKLALLDKLKATDLHTAAWNGEADLVCAHIELAAQHATTVARRDLRHAQKALHALEIEAATMSEKKSRASTYSKGHDSGSTEDLDEDGEADEYELAVAYDEKLGDARDAVAAAEKHLKFVHAKAAEDTVNLVDETEFGGKYTPLHYASYNGHVDVVRILLNYGAHINAKNEAECTALFLASQQGKCHVVQMLLEHEAKPDGWCEQSNLVPSGDGRLLCPLDVVRTVDKSPSRVQTRNILLNALKSRVIPRGRSIDATGCPSKPEPPDAADGCNAPGSALGGIEVRWKQHHYTDFDTPNPPVQSIKVKVVSAEHYKAEGARAPAAALLVARASAHRVRVAATETDHVIMGQLTPQRRYIAMIACINSVGAGEYSEASNEVCALSRRPVAASRTSLSKSQESEVQQRRVDPKIARARIAVKDGREKRQRVSGLMKAAAAQRQAAASRYSKKNRSKEPKLQSVPEQAEYHQDLLPAARIQQSSPSTKNTPEMHLLHENSAVRSSQDDSSSEEKF